MMPGHAGAWPANFDVAERSNRRVARRAYDEPVATAAERVARRYGFAGRA